MKRTLPGLLLAAFWLLLLLKGSALHFWFVMSVIALIAAHEYVSMISLPALGKVHYLIGVALLAMPVLLFMPKTPATFFPGLCFLGFFLLCLYTIICYRQAEESYLNLSKLAFGFLLVGMLAAHLLLVRYLPEGNKWLIVLAGITAGSDSGAYYAGRFWGKRPLCPQVSPKKTIEGALGGFAAGIFLALFFAFLLFDHVKVGFVFFGAIVLTALGIIGDLTESIVKRGTGVKDSGSLLSGHGGVLDRMDSLLMTAPALYYMLLLFGHS